MYENSTEDFNTPEFIEHVQNMPIIWDTSFKGFHNRTQRQIAWEELAKLYFDDTEMESDLEECKKFVQRKWKNIRDSYCKVQTYKYVKDVRIKRRKTYLHADKLRFLDRVLPFDQKNPKESHKRFAKFKDPNLESNEFEFINFPVAVKIEENTTLNEDTIKKVKENTQSTTQKPISNVILNPTDDDQLFLLSLLPFMKKARQHKKLEIRQKFMQILQMEMKEIHNIQTKNGYFDEEINEY